MSLLSIVVAGQACSSANRAGASGGASVEPAPAGASGSASIETSTAASGGAGTEPAPAAGSGTASTEASAAASGGAAMEASPGVPRGKPSGKISADLLALYAAYQDAKQHGVDFRPGNPTVRIVDDRVLIDAAASRDAQQLQTDLAALGLQHGAAFGRMVSGQLPIAAIPELAKLESLAFARSTSPVTRPAGRSSPPSRP